ncbi:hypothetical protein PRIPAC_74930 [Pristionchus pacificus]|uniref:Cytochrome P450 n=1 Tax=Pristionchus pacificus TaxID=54126 RepID=A0A2A6BRD8_PRIPA|nr:hypothetical protein PRIPAC_74930 [Pristionchus pacificus]|eukprot:PDM68522.1 cytochrome P450 [Pristionchus pacificus]
MPTVIVALLIALTYLAVSLWTRGKEEKKGKKLPPAPKWRLPVIGHAAYLDKDKPFEQIHQWSKELGDVMTVHFGMDPVIVVSRERMLNEAFLKQSSNFSGRPSLFVHESCWGKGLVIRDGKEALSLRSFIMSTIRQRIVSSADCIQSLVSTETTHLIDRISARVRDHETPSSSAESFAVTSIEDDLFYVVGNVMTQLAFGRRYDHGSIEFKNNASWLTTTTELMERTAMITFLPWLRWIPYFKYFEIKKKAAEVHATMTEDIHRRRESGDYLDHSEHDLMSVFMRRIDDESERIKNGEDSLFTDDMLARIMTELFFAGIQTECNTFGWAFLYLAINQDIQDKARKHIWDEIGRDGEIRFENRRNLPYIEALVAEVQRIANVAPFGLFHKNHEETTLDGYTIPAGSIVMMNLYSTLLDESVFADPKAFRPERFLTPAGELDQRTMKRSVPYGVGSRVCMGEIIARTELFTVIGSLLQKFRFSLIEGEQYSTEPKLQLTVQAQKYRLRIEFA